MDEVFSLIADVGMPIAGSLIMGVFIFIVIKQILAGIIDQIKTLTMFCESLENRARTMSNEIVKIDLLVSSALDLPPDIDRIARAENFIEDIDEFYKGNVFICQRCGREAVKYSPCREEILDNCVPPPNFKE